MWRKQSSFMETEAGTWKNSPNSIYSNYIGYKTKTGNNYIYPINTFLTAAYGRQVYGYVEDLKKMTKNILKE